MIAQPTSWQQIEPSTNGARRFTRDAVKVTRKVKTMPAPQTGMVITCALALVQPSSFKMDVMKADIDEAVISQQKKHSVKRWILQSTRTFDNVSSSLLGRKSCFLTFQIETWSAADPLSSSPRESSSLVIRYSRSFGFRNQDWAFSGKFGVKTSAIRPKNTVIKPSMMKIFKSSANYIK